MTVLEVFACPKCGGTELRVLDTRRMVKHVRRRRQCTACAHIFSTREYVGRVSNSAMDKLVFRIAQEVKELL